MVLSLDDTNYELVICMAGFWKKGIEEMRQGAEIIRKKIEEIPAEVTARFSQDDVGRLDKLLKYFKWERFFLWVYIAGASFIMGICMSSLALWIRRRPN